jgi:hypothetical protein
LQHAPAPPAQQLAPVAQQSSFAASSENVMLE